MKKLNKKGIIACSSLAICCFIISILLEVFLFNFDYFYYGNIENKLPKTTFHNVVKEEDGKYVITENDAWITINNIEGYVNTLQFQANSFNKDIFIEVEYNNKKAGNGINSSIEKVIPIREETDQIKINFLDAEGEILELGEFYSVNSLEINLFRIGMMILFFVLISVISYVFFKKGKVKLEFIFLIFILSFGFLNTLMIPVFHTLDESEHFVKSYNLASGNFIMKAKEEIEYPVNFGEFLNRKYIDVNEKFQDTQPKYRNYEEFINETNYLMSFDNDQTEVVYYHSMAETYTVFPYLMSGLGVFIGKLFNFPMLILYYFGRTFNLLMYGIVGFFAIKLIPIGKRLMFLCELIPTAVFLTGAFSADVMINSFGLLIFAIIIKWIVEKRKIRLPQYVFMVVCFFLVTASKVTYVPFFLLCLLLKKENFISRKSEIWIKISIIFLAVVSFLTVYAYGNIMGIAQWPIEGVDVTKQIMFVLTHPLNYIGILINSIVSFWKNLLVGATVLLTYIGQLNDVSFYLLWGMLLFTAIFDVNDQRDVIRLRERVMISVMALGALVLSMTALYVTFTPVGGNFVLGFQGRYLIPLLFPILFLFQRKKWRFELNPGIFNGIVITFAGFMLYYMSAYIFTMFYA